jgi:hypothetical protein
MSRTLALRLALTLASAVAWAATGLAQDADKPRNDALDSLLEKLEGAKDKETDKDKSPAEKPAATNAETKAKPEAAKPSGEVETKDKALDSLLEKLGEVPDKPSPDDRPKGPGGPSDKPTPPSPGGDGKPKPEADPLSGKAKDLDRHIEEEILGRKPKKKGQNDDEGSGPLGKIIKEMREVEERLGKPDTGEETRKKQAEIVKNLEQIIEQLRKQSNQQQGKKQLQLTMKPGQKPGSDPGQQEGANARGVGASKPAKPTGKRSMAGDKSEWGHLPPEIRQELENASSEDGLPSKEDLIRRYFLSLSKKTISREE